MRFFMQNFKNSYSFYLFILMKFNVLCFKCFVLSRVSLVVFLISYLLSEPYFRCTIFWPLTFQALFIFKLYSVCMFFFSSWKTQERVMSYKKSEIRIFFIYAEKLMLKNIYVKYIQCVYKRQLLKLACKISFSQFRY